VDSLRDVRCFALVAERLSFSRAAAELGVSQPAISQAVRRLETTLGVQLFARSSREVQLTAAGKGLLPYAEAVLGAAAALRAEAVRQAAPVIRLAYPPLVGALAARVARRLAKRVEVDLWPAGWGAATAALSAGEVPAAILSAPFPSGFATTARFQVTVGHVAVPAGDPLSGAGRVRPEQLNRYQILMPNNRPPGSMWARLAARLPAPHRYRVIGADIDDFAAALDLVAAGLGLLPAPALLVRAIRRPDVVFVPLDAGELRLMYGLSWSQERASPELLTVVQAVHDALRSR
jgi:DNA-binding transcriptional LysR family regulator